MRKVIGRVLTTDYAFRYQVLLTIGAAGFLNTLGVLTGIMAARLLGPAGRGELAAIQAWGAFFATLGMLGLPEAVVFLGSRSPRYLRQHWISATCFALTTGWPILLFGYWVLPWVLRTQSEGVISVTRWYSVALFVAFALNWMPLSAFRSLQKVAVWNVLRVLPSLGWLGVLGLGFALREASPAFLAYSFVLVYLAIGVFTFVVGVWKTQGPFLPQIRWWRSMVSFGLPTMLSIIPTQLFQRGRLSQLVIAAFLEPQVLGFFAVAVAWASVAEVVPQAIGAVAFPRVASRRERTAQASEVVKSIRASVLSQIAVCGILLVMAPIAIPLLFGEAFSPAIPAAMVLVLAGGFAGLRRVLGDCLRGLGRPRTVLAGELVGIGVTTVGLLILIQPLGIIGASLAMLIGDGIAMALLIVVVKRAVHASLAAFLRPAAADLGALRATLKVDGVRWIR